MGEKAERGTGDERPWADLLDRHRADWVAALAGERSLLWLDDYTGAEGEPDAEEFRAAVAEGRPVVVGLRADAGGAAAREARRLAAELGGVTMCQRLAAGSLISADDGEASDAVHFLVCVNADEARTAGASGAADVDAAPLLSGYVRFLEEANRSLSEANERLARERMGVHDSAAAALAAELKEHRDAAEANHAAMLEAKAALTAPRYRAVDKLRRLLFEVPGLSALLRLRSRLISGRGKRR